METAGLYVYNVGNAIRSLGGAFCRGCGYCMPCTVGIEIFNCNRMSLMLRRAPSEKWASAGAATKTFSSRRRSDERHGRKE
jgi:predicted aldo/keto reductase-like oxidoreductase